MQTRLIINADDFGASHAINTAVMQAHARGILTSASLMVTGDAFHDAVKLSQETPSLAVGLHLALTSARSILSKAEIPHLIDDKSFFASDPAAAGLRYFFFPSARKELGREIEAQFEAFAETGIPISHVDGHQHIHLHPAVLPTVIEMCRRYGVSGLRRPREPFWRNLAVDRSGLLDKTIVALGHRIMTGLSTQKVRRAGFAMCDSVVGSMMSGRVNEDYLIRLLPAIRASSIEIFFHPADSGVKDYNRIQGGPNAGDLETLLSPNLRSFLISNGYRLTNYRELTDDFTEDIRATN